MDQIWCGDIFCLTIIWYVRLYSRIVSSFTLTDPEACCCRLRRVVQTGRVPLFVGPVCSVPPPLWRSRWLRRLQAMREGVCVPSESCSVLEISVCLQRECDGHRTVRPASMSSSVLSKVSMQNRIRFAFLKSNVLWTHTNAHQFKKCSY